MQTTVGSYCHYCYDYYKYVIIYSTVGLLSVIPTGNKHNVCMIHWSV